MIDGSIVTLNVVFNEIKKGNDALVDWADNLRINHIDHRNADIVASYRTVMQYIFDNPMYLEGAHHSWANLDVADPWIVAAAHARKYTVISFEEAGKTAKGNKTKKVKIPDVCMGLGVRFISPFEMLDRLEFCFKS